MRLFDMSGLCEIHELQIQLMFRERPEIQYSQQALQNNIPTPPQGPTSR